MSVKNVSFRSQIDRLPSAGPPCASTIFAYATLTQEFGFQLWGKNRTFRGWKRSRIIKKNNKFAVILVTLPRLEAWQATIHQLKSNKID